MLWQLALAALAKDQVQFPMLISGSLQQPVSPHPGDPAALSGLLWASAYTYINPHTEIHMNKQI